MGDAATRRHGDAAIRRPGACGFLVDFGAGEETVVAYPLWRAVRLSKTRGADG